MHKLAGKGRECECEGKSAKHDKNAMTQKLGQLRNFKPDSASNSSTPLPCMCVLLFTESRANLHLLTTAGHDSAGDPKEDGARLDEWKTGPISNGLANARKKAAGRKSSNCQFLCLSLSGVNLNQPTCVRR